MGGNTLLSSKLFKLSNELQRSHWRRQMSELETRLSLSSLDVSTAHNLDWLDFEQSFAVAIQHELTSVAENRAKEVVLFSLTAQSKDRGGW